MSYQVIARKWRPQSFEQLVGQNHVSQTLQNALKNGRLHHALLFTGPRGTGKTSSARILAKSLRCPKAVDFVPCNQCDECNEIALSRSIDVIEIDGASNNGVDAIRELRDTVGYMPASGKFKIYIIDEVHMLSTSAFNALLKTLEEPPAHVIFIMATTEAHKIPQTILSRCQRFDFRSISTRQITETLKTICQRENVTADEDALWIIARQGDGSMRDSQSLLDQVITFANGPLSRQTVVEILGLTDRAMLLDVLANLVNRDQSGILKDLEKIHLSGVSPTLFAHDLLENIRNLLLIKVSPDGRPTIIEMPDSEIRFLKDLGLGSSEEDLHLLFDMSLKGANDIARASEPRIVLEMMLLRMSQAPRIANLSDLFKGGQISLPTQPTGKTASPQPALVKKVDPVGLNPQDRWLEFVQKVRSADALFAAKIENLLFLGDKDKKIELAVPQKLAFLKDQVADATMRQKFQQFVDQFWGTGFSMNIQLSKDEAVGTSAKQISQKKAEEKEADLAKKVADHPLVKSATAAFKGQIKSIKTNQP